MYSCFLLAVILAIFQLSENMFLTFLLAIMLALFYLPSYLHFVSLHKYQINISCFAVHLLATVPMCENSCFTCVFLSIYLLLSGSMCAKCHLTFKRVWLNSSAMAMPWPEDWSWDCRVYVRNIRDDLSHEMLYYALQGQVPEPLDVRMCSKKHEGDTSGMVSAFLQLLAIA